MSDDPFNDADKVVLALVPNLRAMVEVMDPKVGEEVMRLVRMITGTIMPSNPRASFAAAQVTMMDREGGAMRAICYPVTRVELLNVFPDRMPQRFRAFRVDDDGWIEEQ